MLAELGVRAGASRDVTGAPRPFAPGLLRLVNHAGARASSRRPGATRPRDGPGAALDATAGQRRAALPPGRRVVALREADGMTHPAIPEVCPPGEGVVLGQCRD